MADAFRYPLKRSNNYLGAYRLLPSTKAALPVLEDMQFEAAGGGAAVFVGTSTITFSQSGALLAGTALTGTAPLTFSQTGDFTAGGGVGGSADFVGTTTLVFGQTGVFAARAAFSGSTPVTFSQSGALRGGASFSGASTVAFSQSGTLRSGAGLQGVTALNFTQSGDFIAGAGGAAANFSGSVTVTFGATGSFDAGTSQGQSQRGDDAAPRIYYIRKAKRLKEELDRPAPLRKERKQRVIEIQEALEPVRAELADYAINVDVSAIDARLEAFAQSQLGYASLIAGLNEYLANVERQLQAEQHSREQRRKRNRRIAIAMLLSA